jgi:predicted Zn-dependent peptidase
MMGQESVSNRMYQIAHDEIYAGQYIEPREQLARVMAVTHDQVVEAARTFLKPERFALTALGPAPGGPLDPRDWEIASTAAA